MWHAPDIREGDLLLRDVLCVLMWAVFIQVPVRDQLEGISQVWQVLSILGARVSLVPPVWCAAYPVGSAG